MRHAQPVDDSPILQLEWVDCALSQRGLEPSLEHRRWLAASLIDELVCERLQELRDGAAVPAGPARESALALLRSDFSADDLEREAWSVLHLRYLSDAGIQMGQLPSEVGVGRATVTRRLKAGLRALAGLLRERELAAIQSRRALTPARPDAPAASIASLLPSHRDRFVGRERALEALSDWVDSGRLITLVGTGGVGKTRLAIELATREVERFAGGIWWAGLGPIEPEDDLAELLAAELGLAELQGQQPVEALCGFLGRRPALLIVDNCEHLREAVASVVDALLDGCPSLCVIATSREALSLPGERIWPVRPLSLPPPHRALADAETASPAEALFLDRLAAVRPGSRLDPDQLPIIRRICRQLDGLPLAIELAAARARSMSLPQIEGHLEDRFALLSQSGTVRTAHHRSLRAALDWSYALLSPIEKQLFERLSVFPGGFTLEAAEQVCADDQDEVAGRAGSLDRLDVLDVLASLIDKSLVPRPALTAAEPRYRMLESVRSYAGDRLWARGDSAPMAERLAGWCQDLVEQAAAGLQAEAQPVWLERLAGEHDNLHAALRYAVEQDRADLALALASGLGRYWLIRGHLRTGRRWLASALGLPGAARVRDALRAKALEAQGDLAAQQADFEAARQSLQAALLLHEQSRDVEAVAGIYRRLGNIADEQADYVAAKAYYQEAFERYTDLDHAWGRAATWNNQGLLAYHQSDFDEARELLVRSLDGFDALGERWAVGVTHFNLGNVAYDLDQLDRARDHYQSSLEIASQLQDKVGVASATKGLGNVALAQDQLTAARRLCEHSLQLLDELDDQRGLAEILESMAEVESRSGHPEQAVRLLAQAARIREKAGAPLMSKDRARHRARLAALREGLGDERFESAWRDGGRESWSRLALGDSSGLRDDLPAG